MAGWLLNVGRLSEVDADGEEVGEGAVVSSGEGVGATGVTSGVGAAGATSGVGVGVATGVAVGVLAGVSEAVGAGVLVGAVTLAGGEGELADGPPAGSAGFCPHPTISKLATAMGAIKRVFMPLNTDAREASLFKARYTQGRISSKVHEKKGGQVPHCLKFGKSILRDPFGSGYGNPRRPELTNRIRGRPDEGPWPTDREGE